jgi:hypothetical protein
MRAVEREEASESERANEGKRKKNKFKPQMMPTIIVVIIVITPMTTVDIHF